MDPQQRLMLELTWSCLEDSGYSPLSFSGKNVGVFIGVWNFDYTELQENYIDGHTLTGTCNCIIPNRISYFFNFHGPSVPVDTACSSSLVAIDWAIKALKENECEIALVGGISVICSPTRYICLSKLGMLSPQGQCNTFDTKADGYVRGEGAGLILLKPLRKAIKDNDRIYGVIRGSAVNHSGYARTLTAPSADAQSQVMRSAYIKAGIPPNTVSYIEAHGTGTLLGDPIEVDGLKQVFALHQQYDIPFYKEPSCGLGSVKTNIGHLESAAGIAGVIKVLLAMKHKKLPKIVNFKQLNPQIKLDGSPFYIVEQTKDWQQLRTKEGDIIPRRAGVNSFGFGGVNAHVILEEAPAPESKSAEVERTLQLLTLSAKSEKALLELAQSYGDFFATNPESYLADVCFTANTGRSHFDHRLAVIFESTVQLREQLSAFATIGETAGLVTGQVPHKSPKIAFLFTGQGSQYIGMGRQIYETQPTFRACLDRCAEILGSQLEKPLLDVLYPQAGETSPLDETAYTQPALFALEYALANLWQSWGIMPQVVMGHSVGEYVAACVAGVFSLEDALKLIAARGRLMQALPENGEMVAVFAPEATVAAAIQPYAQSVAIAAVNGQQSIVISGQSEAVRCVVATLEAAAIKTVKLNVSHAFHSPLMEPMLANFEQVAREITYSSPSIDIISNVTGKLAGAEIGTPEYWCRHVQQSVRFATGMETLHHLGYEVFVECGPKPTLLGMGRHCLPEKVGVWLKSLHPEQSDWQPLLRSLVELYVRGVAVDWLGFDRDYPRRKVALPTYPFQRQRYWIETTETRKQAGEPLSSEATTPTLKLLYQGDTKQLAQLLETFGNFSSLEKKLMPKLLEAIVEQHPQQLKADSIKHEGTEVEWQPQAIAQLPPDYLPTPVEVKEALMPLLGELIPQPELTQLEALSVTYILNAFKEMGWEFQLRQRFSTSSIAKQLRVVDQHMRLLNRLLEILTEVGMLQQIGNEWEVTLVPEIQNPQKYWSTLLAQYPVAQAELTLLGRCGSRLAEVLQGACDPLQLLFPEADITTAERLYQDSSTFASMNTLVQRVISDLMKHLPQGQRVQILEIKAGTGGTSSYILPHLPAQQTEYVFTDVGAFFTKKAQEKFRNYPFVQYKVLDIEQTPELQGFALHQYDLILAANVLHASSDLRQTLQHIQKLLIPGGMLLLLEGTSRRRWIDLIFGLVGGWWKFTDQDLRSNYPLLSTAQWQSLLEDSGFKQVATIAPDQDRVELLFPQAVILAQTNLEIKSQLSETGNKSDDFLQKLEATPINARRDYLVSHVRLLVVQTLDLNPSQPIDLQQGFSKLGMDSLTSVDLRNRLQTSLGCKLHPTLVFDYPTIEAMVDYLAKEVLTKQFFDADSTSEVQQKDETAELLASLESQSDDEIADLLAQKLASITAIFK
jgi:microcystin synthetase protein McyG